MLLRRRVGPLEGRQTAARCSTSSPPPSSRSSPTCSGSRSTTGSAAHFVAQVVSLGVALPAHRGLPRRRAAAARPRARCRPRDGAEPRGLSRGPSPRRATSRRCARAARCPRSSRPTTTGSTSSSSAARGRGRRRSSRRWWPASSPARSGCPVPELVLVELDPAIGRAEPDAGDPGPAARERGARTSALDFLPGSLPFSPAAGPAAGRRSFAADVVWLDALVTNVDRTAQNPNLLDLARPHLADRPRRRALLAPLAGPTAATRADAVRRRSATTCCCRSPPRSPRPTPGSRRASRATCSSEIVAAVPAAWLEGDESRRCTSTT